MALYFRKHPRGPELPEAFQTKGFRSFVDMANFADTHRLPDGNYYIRNTSGKNLGDTLRELRYSKKTFHVEGRGNI